MAGATRETLSRDGRMSNTLAIAGVSAALKDLLATNMLRHRVADALGAAVTVSVLSPDLVPRSDHGPYLNLFLYQVTENTALRNVAPSSRSPAAQQPLALDLHYLLTAYGAAELHAEVLLGAALSTLHEHPVLQHDQLRAAFTPTTTDDDPLAPAYQALAHCDLALQEELLRITPAGLNLLEMSRIFSATQSPYRPSIGVRISVVLIDPP
jgi:Pvc16 N-terminal domain